MGLPILQGGEMPKYKVLGNILHDGMEYAPGDLMELDSRIAVILPVEEVEEPEPVEVTEPPAPKKPKKQNKSEAK